LEIVDLKHLQVTQDEMMKKLAIMDDENVVGNGGGEQSSSSASATPKVHKKMESNATSSASSSSSKRQRWKHWGWKHSPAKSSSIEEEPAGLLLESPRKSQSSTPNASPKHKSKVPDANGNAVVDNETTTPFRRKKRERSESARASAGARLIQTYETKDGIERTDSDCDEFRALLPVNGRPASIHIIQSSISSQDEF